MKQPQSTHTPHPMTRQRGLSMVELMVAITISLLLLAGVIQIFLATRQTYTLQDGMSRLQENARYALERITQDIAKSGYMGCSDSANIAVDNNLVNKAGRYDFTTPVSSQNDTGIDGTDILTLRFGSSGGIAVTAPFDPTTSGRVVQVNSADPNYNQLEQYDLLTFGDCDHIVVVMITNDPAAAAGALQFQPGIAAPAGPNTGQQNQAVFETVGNIGAQTTTLATAFSITTATYLVGASSNGNGNSLYVDSIAPQNELIQGVENFQVQFGVNDDNDLGADRYVDAGNVGAANWNNVVSVRINLRLNTVDPVQAGNTIAKDFTTTVRLRNRGESI